MNKQEYIKELIKYVEILQEYKTPEEKIEYLEDCQWNIDMIDRWSDSDRLAYEIITDLIKYIKQDQE